MLRLFSSIRKTLINERKTSRYVRYAVGEVLLIMVGIILALQFQTWNEERKDSLLRDIYIDRLVTDIENDIDNKTHSLTYNSQLGELLELLLETVRNPEAIKGKPVEFLAAIMAVAANLEGSLYSGTYEELQSTGNLRLIDEELKTLLHGYHRVDNDLRQFLQVRHETTMEYIRYSKGILSLDQQDFLIDNELHHAGALKEMRSFAYDEGETMEAFNRLRENKDFIDFLPRMKWMNRNVIRHDTERLELAETLMEALQSRQQR